MHIFGLGIIRHGHRAHNERLRLILDSAIGTFCNIQIDHLPNIGIGRNPRFSQQKARRILGLCHGYGEDHGDDHK